MCSLEAYYSTVIRLTGSKHGSYTAVYGAYLSLPLELMSATQVGDFVMTSGSKSCGLPGPVRKVLDLFGSGQEEDRLLGYLTFLKFGPKLLKFIPGRQIGRAVGAGPPLLHRRMIEMKL